MPTFLRIPAYERRPRATFITYIKLWIHPDGYGKTVVTFLKKLVRVKSFDISILSN